MPIASALLMTAAITTLLMLAVLAGCVAGKGRARSALSIGVGLRIRKEAQAFADAHRGADGICLVVHVPFPCTSFALPASLAHSRGRPLEWCLVTVYASEAVIAHEILHLFGADDHYHRYTAEEKRAKQEFIGRSIMFAADRAIDELALDGVTAQSVGWL